MKTQLLILLLFLQVSVVSLANTPPSVAFGGYQSTSVCTPQSYIYFVDGMQLYDVDGDTLSLSSVASSNTSLINPANLSVFVALPDNFSQSYVSVSGPVGTVGSPTNVTLTFTFDDGNGGTLSHPITYTLKPSPTVVFLETGYEMCSSQGVVDVNEWVYPVGGTFFINSEQEFSDGIFHTDWVNYNFSLEYEYTAANGCASSASVPISFYQAPTIDLYTSNSTSCVTGDGGIDAAINSEYSYTFVWNDGNTFETDRTGLLPGIYHIDVTDQHGCIAEASASVLLDGVSFNEVIDTVSCYDGNDGAIAVNITGLVSPLDIYWSTGSTSMAISNLVAGTYTLNITDATGCAFAQSFVVPQHDPIYVDSYSYYPFDCISQGGISISYISGGGGYPYDVQWSNGVTGYSNYNIDPGYYTAVVSDPLGCSTTVSYIINDYDSPWAYLDNIEAALCNTAEGVIDLDTSGVGEPITISWSNSATTLDLVDVVPGDYVLHMQDANGCDSYGMYTVPVKIPSLQQICMVSVDSATTTNLVIWEKVDPNHVAYYNIYRETVNPNEFMLIDSVSNNDESIFNDVMASPTVQSWRYKISAVDECGTEGPLSTAHKTMHIVTTDLGNGDFQATWNPYYGVEYDFYKLYRFTALTGWEEIATLPSVVNSYIDTPPNSVDLDYMTELDLDFSCIADVFKIQDFNTTRSNKDKGNFILGQGTGDSNNEVGEQAITMTAYPNPVADQLTVEVSENGTNKLMYLVTVDGQVIREIKMNSVMEVIDMSSLSNGLYFLKVEGQNETIPVVKN